MSAEKKKELQVAALENGTAIDHIPPSQLFKVAKLLGLENMDNTITIGNNFHSNKMGSKGMIKISDKFFCDEDQPHRPDRPKRDPEHYPRLRSGGEKDRYLTRRTGRARKMQQSEMYYQ